MNLTKLKTIDFVKMLNVVRENSEREGHFSHFANRLVLWDHIKKTNQLIQLIPEFVSNFELIHDKWTGKPDGEIKLYMEWTQILNSLIPRDWLSIIDPQESDSQVIMQTIGKHAFNFLTRLVMEQGPSTSSIKEPVQSALPQPTAGLHIIAGGVLGSMFRQLKKDRNARRSEFRILCRMIVTDKKNTTICVEQTSRDKGGLYIMQDKYSTALAQLDKLIRDELKKYAIHDKNLVRVSLQQSFISRGFHSCTYR